MLSLLTRVSANVLMMAVVTILFVSSYSGAEAAVIGMPSGTIELDGYMWSSTIGWISLNCKTGSAVGGDVCGTSNYAVSINSSGNISGFAWSSNIGWIKFGSLKNFPTGAGTSANNAQVTGTYPALTFDGWARACSGINSALDAAGNDTCDGSTPGTPPGGWDGWISLNGTRYGLKFDTDGTMLIKGEATTTATGGFFWGSDIVGWIGADASMNWSQINASINGNSCIIARGASTCIGSLDWKFNPITIDSPTIYEISPSSTVRKTNVASSTTGAGKYYRPTLAHGYTYTYQARSGTLSLAAASVSAVCDVAAGDKWDSVKGSCQFSTSTVPVVNLSSNQKAVRGGQPATLNWDVAGVLDVRSCTLSGPGVVAHYMETLPLTNFSGTYQTAPIKGFSTFSLKCTTGTSTDSASVSVEMIPTVTEI